MSYVRQSGLGALRQGYHIAGPCAGGNYLLVDESTNTGQCLSDAQISQQYGTAPDVNAQPPGNIPHPPPAPVLLPAPPSPSGGASPAAASSGAAGPAIVSGFPTETVILVAIGAAVFLWAVTR